MIRRAAHYFFTLLAVSAAIITAAFFLGVGLELFANHPLTDTQTDGLGIIFGVGAITTLLSGFAAAMTHRDY